MTESVQQWKNGIYVKIERLISRGHLEEALTLIECLAHMEYVRNQTFRDDRLEGFLKSLSEIFRERNALSFEKRRDDNVVFFYDGFGFNTRGLALIYVSALSQKFRLFYAIDSSNKDNIATIRETIEKNGGTIRYLQAKSRLEKTKELINMIEESAASSLFLYIYPWDVSTIMAYCFYDGIARRFQINLTDHAFWLGTSALDVCIEFRQYGASVSRDYRGIDAEKIVMLPYYPYFNPEQHFDGYPFPFNSEKNKLMFSGGSLYKTISPKKEYYQFVRKLLDSFPETVFWYAGSGADVENDMNALLRDYPNRAFWTSERRDLFQILQRAEFYIDTYPLFGGLMIQYASLAGTMPITVRNGNVTGGTLLAHEDEIILDNFEQAFERASELLRMKPEERVFLKQKLSETVITPEEFREELSNIVLCKGSKYPVRFEPVSLSESNAIYQYQFDARCLDRFLAYKKSVILFKKMPFRFLKGAIWKFFSTKRWRLHHKKLLKN